MTRFASIIAAAIASIAFATSAQAQKFTPEIISVQEWGTVEAVENCEPNDAKMWLCDVYNEDGDATRMNVTNTPKGMLFAGDRVNAMRVHEGTRIASVIVVNGEPFTMGYSCNEDTAEKRQAKVCQKTYPE